MTDRETLAKVDDALASWETRGATSLTVALVVDALYSLRRSVPTEARVEWGIEWHFLPSPQPYPDEESARRLVQSYLDNPHVLEGEPMPVAVKRTITTGPWTRVFPPSPDLGDDPDGDLDEIEAIALARSAGYGYQPPNAKDSPVAALERLSDQAWHTAGNSEGKQRVHEDHALILGALSSNAEEQVREVQRVIEALRAAHGSIHGPVVDEIRHSTADWLDAALDGRLDPEDARKGYSPKTTERGEDHDR